METEKMENKQIKFITPINHALLIISSLAISIILIISWALAISWYRDNINEFLTLISTMLKKKGYDYEITFQYFTIGSLVFSILALITSAIPFIFIRKKRFTSLIAAIFSLLYSLIILIILGGVIYICFDPIKTYINDNSISAILIFLLPWGLEILFAIILLISALWLLLTFFHKPKEKANRIIKLNAINTTSDNKKMNNEDEITNNIQQQIPMGQIMPQAPPIQPQHTGVINPQTQQPTTSTPTTSSEIKIYINSNEKASEVIKTSHSPSQGTITAVHKQAPIQESPFESIAWTSEEIESVWNKSEIIAGYDPKLYRKDYAGALMFYKAFINNPTAETETNAKSYNWTIAFQKPINHGGTTNDDNLLAMNTLNFLKKGNHYPRWKTAISYNGKENIIKEKQWKDK